MCYCACVGWKRCPFSMIMYAQCYLMINNQAIFKFPRVAILMFLTKTKKEYSKLNCNSQLAASDIMEEEVPRVIPAWQHDISFTLKPCRGSGWWILQRDTVVPELRSVECSPAVKCAVIGFECIAALCSSVWLKAGPDMFNSFSSGRCELHYTSAKFTPVLLSLLPGGCSISPPVLFTPFVGFYLGCAVYPTSQPSPVSAGSKSAAQTMVRPIQECVHAW